jgi:hypothetical protein
MAFNIHQKLFNRNGELLEDAAILYQDQLLALFDQSPEAQEFRNEDRSTGWTSMLLDYGFDYIGVTPPQMSPDNLREILFEIFPRKVSAPAEDAPDVIAELLAFWKFLQREFHLENAAANIAILNMDAVRMLKEEMNNPDNFGMAKSFMTLGRQMGFDMASEEGINQWAEAFNTGVAPSLALSPPPPSITLSPEDIEIVQPLRFTLKRVTGKGHKKNRKRK